jgi:hypothetical protein
VSAELFRIEKHGLASGVIVLQSGRVVEVWAYPNTRFVTTGEITEEEHDEIEQMLTILHTDFTGYVH